MPVFELPDEHLFPRLEFAEEDGLLAVGGDLSPGRLLTAYQFGIFPWYGDDSPILWWSPDPRLVLFPKELKVQKSLRPVFRKKLFRVTYDADFEAVIRACKETTRRDQDGSWITEEMVDAYIELHELGYAHSVEVWEGEELVGGVYGIALGTCFFGESMFSKASNASKVGFIHLVKLLERLKFRIIDCQVKTDHLIRFGAREIPRAEFAEILAVAIREPTLRGNWGEMNLPTEISVF